MVLVAELLVFVVFVAVEDVFDVANVVEVDFAELLCEVVWEEDEVCSDEDLGVVMVVVGVVLDRLGTLMVVFRAYQP